MTEQDLSIRIKDELYALKAPADLVARTKEAVSRAEAEAVTYRKRRNRFAAGGSMLAAAAVLFLLISPFAFRQRVEGMTQSQTDSGAATVQSDASQTGTWLRLGSLTDGREVYLEEEVSVERIKILPMIFRQAECEDIINGMTVRYVRDENGFWTAAIEDNEAYVVIITQVTDEQEIIDIMEKLLSEE